MTLDLLTIVQAEEEAEALIKQAEEQKNKSIEDVVHERSFKLENLKPPTLQKVSLKPLKPNLEKYKTTAKKNMKAAVKRILEEVYAAT